MFKPVFIEEMTIDSMWFKLLYELHKNGRVNKIDAGSFAGSTRLEFDYVAGCILYPTTRPLAPIFPEGLSPVTTDEEIEHYFIDYIMNGELEDNEHYKYATFISGGKYTLPKTNQIKFYGNGLEIWSNDIDDKMVIDVPNQVQWVINHYKTKGFGNNHCAMNIGYPESNFAYDISYANEAERQTSPCLRLIDSHIKNNKLHFHVVFRSWALYSAFPTNIGGFTMLMEFMANELGIEVGTLSFSCLKLHAYDFEIKPLKARLGVI